MATVGRDPEQTRNELSAGATGSEALQRQYAAGAQADEATQQRQTQSFIASDEQKTKNRGLDIESQRRQDEADYHKQEAANTEDRNSIEAAHLGVQPQGKTRAQQVREEMDRGRLQTQMDKPLEVPGPDQKTHAGYAKTTEQSNIDADTSLSRRLNAQASFNRSVQSLKTAKLTGDKETAKNERSSLMKPIESWQNIYNTARGEQFGKDGLDPAQKASLKADLGSHNDPELKAELDSGKVGPKTLEAVQAKIDMEGLKFMAATGDEPDSHLVNPSSPMRRAYQTTADGMASFLKFVDGFTYGGLSQVYKIDSLAKKNEVLRMLSAQAVVNAAENPAAKSTNPGSLPTPSAGMQQQGGGSNVGPGSTGAGAGQQQPSGPAERQDYGGSLRGSYRNDKQRAGAPRPGLK